MKIKGNQYMKTKTIARFALLTALALVLGYLEAMIPITPTIPGIKLGLANTVLLYAVYMGTPLEACLLMICKVFLSSMLFGGGFSAMLYSLGGGVLSLAAMLILFRITRISVIGVSAGGAICHNLGQIIVASWILGVGAVWAYFPILVVSGLVMGPLTGLVAVNVFRALKKSGGQQDINPRAFEGNWKADVVIILLLMAVSGLCWWMLNRKGLNPDSSETESDYYAEVVQNNEVLYEIPVNEYGKYAIENPNTDGYNVLVISKDGVYMESANCPDKICVNQGTIHPEDVKPITCLPNRLSVQIIEQNAVPDDFDLGSQQYEKIKIE